MDIIKIPTGWHLRITLKNRKELETWRIKQPNVSLTYNCFDEDACYLLSSHPNDNSYLWFADNLDDGEEITLEFFRKHILKLSMKDRLKLLKL